MKNKLVIVFVIMSLVIVTSVFVFTSSSLLINISKDEISKSTLTLLDYSPLTVEHDNKLIENQTEQINYTKSRSSGSSKSSKKKKDSAECSKDTDCSFDYFFNFCENNNFTKDLRDFSCVKGECVENITKTIIEKCGVDECMDWGENYCFNGRVYNNRTCYDRGCLTGGCFANSFSEIKLVENCENGCENGGCLFNWSNLIIIQMDDASAWWNVEVSNALVEAFHNADIRLVTEVPPANLNNDSVFLDYVRNWDSYSNIEIAQGFYSGEGFSPPQDNLSYNETRQNLQLGKLEFEQAGIKQPVTYIPASSYGTTETLDALKDEGFHTEMDYAVAPEHRDGINQFPLTIDEGFEITEKEDGNLKNESDIKSAVDLMIAGKGFANLAFHHQRFGEGVPDAEKINEMINILTSLKNQGYNFITAEDYFQHLNK